LAWVSLIIIVFFFFFECFKGIIVAWGVTMSDNIRFKYVFAEDYNPKYVNGAYGGVSPSGEIVVNFYFERHPLPKFDTCQLPSDGQIGDLTMRDLEDLNNLVIRYIQNGVVISLDHAKEIEQQRLKGKVKEE